jgi:hypothetical protein
MAPPPPLPPPGPGPLPPGPSPPPGPSIPHPPPPPPHHPPHHFGGGGGYYPRYRFWDDWNWFNRPIYVVDTPTQQKEEMNYLPIVLVGGIATVALILALKRR